MRRVLVGAGMLLLLANSGCAGSGDNGQGGLAATTAPSTALSPTTAAPAITVPTPAAAATCTDTTGDGKPADIKSITLRRNSEQLMVQFKLTARPPRTGTVLYSILASSPKGDKALQLGVKYLDGQQIAYFVFDGEGPQQNLPGNASREGSLLTATFPYEAVAALGETWRWSGNTNVEGRDVDDCPNAGADALNPKKARFPG
jgi:hypothetical protein